MIKGNLGIAVMPDFVCQEDSALSIVPMNIEETISYGNAWHQKNDRKEIKGFVANTRETYQR